MDYIYTDEQLIDILQYMDRNMKGVLSISKYNDRRHPDMPCVNTFRRHFGAWLKAKDAAGLDSDRKYSQEYIKRRFLEAVEFFGERMTTKQYAAWAVNNNAPAIRTIKDHFGNFNALKKILGVRRNNTGKSRLNNVDGYISEDAFCQDCMEIDCRINFEDCEYYDYYQEQLEASSYG